MSHERRTINPNGHLEQVHAGKLTLGLEHVCGDTPCRPWGGTDSSAGRSRPKEGGRGPAWEGHQANSCRGWGWGWTRAASAHVVPTPALPLQPTSTPSQVTNAAAGPSWSGWGGACNTSFESSQEVCLSLMFALPNIQLVVLGLFFNDFHCHDFLKGNFIETRGGMRATPAETQSPGGFLQPRPHRHLLRTTREPLVAGRMRSSLLQLPVVQRCPRVQENGIVII